MPTRKRDEVAACENTCCGTGYNGEKTMLMGRCDGGQQIGGEDPMGDAVLRLAG